MRSTSGTAAGDAATIGAASLDSPPGRQAGPVETALHALTRAVEPAHDGANRHADHLCRLPIVEPVHVDELEHLAVVRRQLSESRIDDRVERAAADVLLDGARRPLTRRPVDVLVGVVEELGAPPADTVQVRVADDGEEPGSGVLPVESFDGAIGAYQCVLDQVLGFAGIAGQ